MAEAWLACLILDPIGLFSNEEAAVSPPDSSWLPDSSWFFMVIVAPWSAAVTPVLTGTHRVSEAGEPEPAGFRYTVVERVAGMPRKLVCETGGTPRRLRGSCGEDGVPQLGPCS